MNSSIKYSDLSRFNKVITIGIFLSIFISSFILSKKPFEFYLGYGIIILMLPFLISKHKFPVKYLLFSLFFIITGVFNVFLHLNTYALFFKIYLGVSINYLFYYYVFEVFNKDVRFLFKLYLKGAYILTLIGLFQLISFFVGFKFGYDFSWLLNKWGLVLGGNIGIRINSLYSEPSQYAIIQSPALFVSVYRMFKKDGFYTKNQAVISIIIYLFTFSSLGYLGLFMSIIFIVINLGFIRYLFFFIPILILMFNVLYNNVNEFRDRVDGTTEVFTTDKFRLGESNGSSIILYDNYQVAFRNFKENFLFGTGLGSHPIAFSKYSVTKHIHRYGFAGNQADANSMFLRIVSEAGLFGIITLIWFIFSFYKSEPSKGIRKSWIISNSVLVLILLFLFRQGHYFINGFPFFVYLYYYNSEHYKKRILKTNV